MEKLIQYLLNTQCHSSIKMTPFEAVFGQKTNDGIYVGSQEIDEFIDEEKVEYMFDTEGDLQTGVRTDNVTDTETDTQSNSQKETETDSQTETETDSQRETETNSQTDYRPTQDEFMAVDDIMVLNDIIVDPTDD